MQLNWSQNRPRGAIAREGEGGRAVERERPAGPRADKMWIYHTLSGSGIGRGFIFTYNLTRYFFRFVSSKLRPRTGRRHRQSSSSKTRPRGRGCTYVCVCARSSVTRLERQLWQPKIGQNRGTVLKMTKSSNISTHKIFFAIEFFLFFYWDKILFITEKIVLKCSL